MAILATHKSTVGSFQVMWEAWGRKYHGQSHKVTYGYSERTFSCDLAASREYGECVRHALECAGLFDEELA